MLKPGQVICGACAAAIRCSRCKIRKRRCQFLEQPDVCRQCVKGETQKGGGRAGRPAYTQGGLDTVLSTRNLPLIHRPVGESVREHLERRRGEIRDVIEDEHNQRG